MTGLLAEIWDGMVEGFEMTWNWVKRGFRRQPSSLAAFRAGLWAPADPDVVEAVKQSMMSAALFQARMRELTKGIHDYGGHIHGPIVGPVCYPLSTRPLPPPGRKVAGTRYSQLVNAWVDAEDYVSAGLAWEEFRQYLAGVKDETGLR